ncbi:MAG TPA: 4-hydroxy-tetrahydrodipicolinate synthase [Flavobacteriales bacterium]|nr:4-hydroxy-tetrahydrodipicolinate synthase [Flavobacteriales bacterium]HRE96217.1 4-hydroxy-tetrahydrodipicolinate synthase [Flavobacteriales bacterium]HRJ38414.1 4-hydroxy-tetrahydrodipicolinate synthase [Flavobacteriales bacterium]
MHALSNLRGSIVAIVTPFTADGSIDFQSYANLIKRQIEGGTNGIVVAGTTGESAALTEDEYAALIRFTVQQVNGQVPVIVGAGSNVTARAIRHSQVAQREGADALLILNPYYNKPTEEGIFLHYKSIAENVNLPIILYNVPGRTGSNMRAALTLRIAREIPGIVAIKEASGDLNQIMEIIANRPDGFLVYSGDDAMTLSIIAAGGDGCISVVANQVPSEFSRMIHAALANDLDLARNLHYKLLRLMNLNFIESNPIPVKTCLYMMGLLQNEFRAPMISMTNSSNLQVLHEELRTLEIAVNDRSAELIA